MSFKAYHFHQIHIFHYPSYLNCLFPEINVADDLQRLDTGIMNIAKCSIAHKYSGFPVREDKNICAGGDKGM